MKRYISIILGLLLTGIAYGQANFGNSTPSPVPDCGVYQWPEVSSPCPEVQIKQKHDHTPYIQYRAQQWDTAVTCGQHTIELSCMPYVPVQNFTGGYYVDQIPYNPPDTTFYLSYAGVDTPTKKKLAIQNDDDWAPSFINIAFPFYFFGIQKNQFLLGDNGIVTFANGPGITAGGECPYATTTALPWPTSVPNSPSCNPALMRDAIYGVYEDTYTGSNGSYMSGYQGIYYGVIDDFPCRKIIASWNQIPVFSDASKRQTYQIVCYEGSNIIEVHVKKRNCCSSTNGGNGLIGIQNATGQPQVPGTPAPGSTILPTNFQVINGSPAAFWPNGYNVFNGALENVAFRFTPNGQTPKNAKWFRIFDDGRDSIDLTTDPTDTNGVVYPMGSSPTCPNLTRAVITPTCVSKYVFELLFADANNNRYFLRDTITVGVDTANDLTIHPADSANSCKVLNICEGNNANIVVSYPTTQKHKRFSYSVYRKSGPNTYDLDSAASISVGNMTQVGNNWNQTVTLRSNLPTNGRRQNKIDSVYVQVSADFISDCPGSDAMLVKIYPNFDTTEVKKICKGRSYTWSANNQTYNQNTQATVHLQSTPGCDSTVHLDLTVLETSYTVDHVIDCKAYTWVNGTTYETSNTATAASDTMLFTNIWGCDSIVQLDFQLMPVTANIGANRTFFDFDMLDVVLKDLSSNSTTRMWLLPGGITSSDATVHYTIPADMDSANIYLIAYSAYGCSDSTNIIIPMRKESFWIPNAFTPDNANGNRIFSSISTKTLTEEMYIYNRNGQMVFKCEGPDCPWDGRDMNGNLCPQGVYTYVIRYTNEYLPKQTQVRRGTVTLIR